MPSSEGEKYRMPPGMWARYCTEEAAWPALGSKAMGMLPRSGSVGVGEGVQAKPCGPGPMGADGPEAVMELRAAMVLAPEGVGKPERAATHPKASSAKKARHITSLGKPNSLNLGIARAI